jgi:lupus La protein
MWSLHTANDEHWVPVATIASFKRMREFQPRGVEWVANVLRTSAELEVSADGAKVRRQTEVQEPKGAFDRSVYAVRLLPQRELPPLPQAAESPRRRVLVKKFRGSSENLSNSLPNTGKLGLSVCGVWMVPRRSRYVLLVYASSLRTSDHRQGSVFTEFVDYKSVEAFLNADPKPSWDGQELLIMSKEAYVEMKIKEKGLKGKAAVVKRDHITRKGFDAFREMRLAAEGKKGKKEAEKAKPEIFVELFGTKLRVLEEDGGSVVPEEVPRVRGSALRFSGCGGEVSFDDIKRPLKERFSRAPFVKYTKGDDSGLVGFDKALDEEDIAFVKEKIPTLNGNPVTWELPEGMSIFLFVSRVRKKPHRGLSVLS